MSKHNPKAKRLRRWFDRLLPISRVHHIYQGYGYVLFPWFSQSLFFRLTPDGAYQRTFMMVRKQDYHNCTWTGTY